MPKPTAITTAAVAVAVAAVASVAAGAPAPRPWKKHDINPDVPYEGAGAADLDGDGRIDVFSGDSWYRAPAWTRFKVREVKPSNAHYHEDFADMPLDVNGDGRPDLVTCTYFGQYLGWIEHPGDPRAPWIDHEIDRPGRSEACRLVDIDGDGKLDILPATTNAIVWYDLVRQKPEVKWRKHLVGDKGAGHGVGIGDLDGDGRLDLVAPRGWYRQPADPRNQPWTFHPEFDLGAAGILILVRDVDGDGLADLVWGAAHAYGLFWARQAKDAAGNRTWQRQDIDLGISEVHTLVWAAIDGRRRPPALVTGKRVYGHEIEPGCTDAPGVYAYRYDRKAAAWRKQTLYEGEPAKNAPADSAKRKALADFPRGTAGTGLHIEVADIDRDGDLDLVCPGKSGLYLLENPLVRARAR